MSATVLLTQARSSLPGGRPWVELPRFLVRSFQFSLGIFSSAASSGYVLFSPDAVPSLNRFDGVYKRFFQNALADGPDDQAEQPSLEGFAVTYDDYVDVGRPVGITGEIVSVAGRASPSVGVNGREDDVVGIGPVVVQALPNAARAFCDVGFRRAATMHLEVLVGAVAKKLPAAWPEVGEPGDVLFGR